MDPCMCIYLEVIIVSATINGNIGSMTRPQPKDVSLGKHQSHSIHPVYLTPKQQKRASMQ